MSNQEVWITLTIRSELPVEADAVAFAHSLASGLNFDTLNRAEKQFLEDANKVLIMEVLEERHIYGTSEDKPYKLED